ncbi:asparagine synthase (glutamine-hydrolyzing) [Sporolactobacillus laevolacticus]|uniref:asparagine synthase (glutamine-hydrolyzing) n=1 Tax=Sporolactobacillus laevolacticus DSM 442 TaxID=1395513 RepID=V6IZF2_9BACL|nr:asparagine synthase (glutamine-hydrolyzing) [Sporolactobacillus laevolacticus]EST12860.1 asparagine synthase [Sporolactobacillus laevolacticus DSM 442]MDN3954285.1 asparagine synthase (glutamine-hydrolyzing) [Sporolactobacillus laevolacticus]
MCGFCGYIANKNQLEPGNHEQNAMTARAEIINHRGPDDVGYYTDDQVQLAFRRLSIIDLAGGHQPLPYENERYYIIFNGEVYNYVELRNELIEKGYSFETTSDTEVIVALYADRGVECVNYFRGMFGFIIWDKQERTLFAARDHFGIKPFYYMEQDDGVFFASEMKSLLIGGDPHPVAEKALQYYLTFQFVPEPHTLSENIKSLEPGHYLLKKNGEPIQNKAFWKPSFAPVNQSLDEAKKKIQDVLIDSVKIHMRSDVPVGAFLSSGIDSTSIVALAKRYNENIKTFTVGFASKGYNEIDVARDSAEKLGVENYALEISAEMCMKEMPKIVWHMDNPLADPAAIPNYFVAREARKHVKVVLSGEGSDELFGGYNIYREPLSLKWFDSVPKPGKALLHAVASRMPVGMKGRSYLLRGTTPLPERYVGNAFIFNEEEKKYVLKTFSEHTPFTDVTNPIYKKAFENNKLDQMQLVDIETWLRGDILVVADRMTMAHSLELRVPFLDKEVFEVAKTLPAELKTGDGTTKYAFREAMRGIVPDSILFRKKLGFPVPIRIWLKGEMYDWARKIIHDSNTDAYINKSYALKLLDDHCSGKMDNSRKIWTVLMFMLWHQIYIEKTVIVEHEPAFQV